MGIWTLGREQAFPRIILTLQASEKEFVHLLSDSITPVKLCVWDVCYEKHTEEYFLNKLSHSVFQVALLQRKTKPKMCFRLIWHNFFSNKVWSLSSKIIFIIPLRSHVREFSGKTTNSNTAQCTHWGSFPIVFDCIYFWTKQQNT